MGILQGPLELEISDAATACWKMEVKPVQVQLFCSTVSPSLALPALQYT